MTPGAADGPPAPPSLGVLLFIPYRQMEQRVLAALEVAGYRITLAQARLFQRVDQGGTRLTRLAEAAQLSKQAAGFLVDQLERGGYVERVPDPQDGRARLVSTTARGREVIAVAALEQARVEAEWTEHLGAEAVEGLSATLVRLREITDPYA